MVRTLLRTVWGFVIKLNTRLAHGPAISLLDEHTREMKTKTWKTLHKGLHSSFIYNGPKLAVIQVDKEIVV